MADLEDAVNEVASARDRPSGSIRISASENAAKPLVRHVLPEFLAAYPDIHVEFVVDTRLVDIVADGFDAGIRVLQDVPRDMVAVRFGPDMRFATRWRRRIPGASRSARDTERPRPAPMHPLSLRERRAVSMGSGKPGQEARAWTSTAR